MTHGRPSWLLLALACAGPACADPMRPLTAPMPPADAAPAAARPLAAAGAASAAPAPPPEFKGRLVAIRTDERGRRQALLDDTWLAAGDRLGPHRVLAVEAHHVELQTGARPQRLHLLPPLQRQPAAGGTHAAAPIAAAADAHGARTP